MSFPIGSLTGEDAADGASAPAEKTYKRQPRKQAAPPEPRSSKMLRSPLVLIIAAIVWLLWVVAMLTHSTADAAFSNAGTPGLYANRVGALGAWASDLLLFTFGYSSWWLPLVALRLWLGGLAGLLRHAPDEVAGWRRWLPWSLGLLALLMASCALEWTRLYGWESRLPGPAGGVLGYQLGVVEP